MTLSVLYICWKIGCTSKLLIWCKMLAEEMVYSPPTENGIVSCTVFT